MRLGILTPSAEYAGQAGARIRYGRMAEALAQAGVRSVLQPIGDFDPQGDLFDAVLVSKCHDARAVLTAAYLRRRGVAVGVDLFDDYFSQSDDPRLSRYRMWFRQMTEECGFVLCSTPAMEAIVHSHAPDLPVHVLNDPGSTLLPPEAFASLVDEKVRHALETRRVEMCWFGRGSNPHFPIGLADVAAFGPDLVAFVAVGFVVRLTVVTNLETLTPDAMEAIRRLPAEIVFEAWDEAREVDVLTRSLVAFLPVNAQRFSAAKSLNRAVSALQKGCQVLSTGFPLYRRLAPYIYHEAGELVRDLNAGQARLSRSTVPGLAPLLDDVASAAVEARRLAIFLSEQCTTELSADAGEAPSLALLHGVASSKAVNEFAAGAGALTVASVFTSVAIDTDVRFVLSEPGGEPAMLVAESFCERLAPDVRSLLRPCDAPWRGYWTDAAVDPVAIGLPPGWTLAFYASVMAEAAQRLRVAFGSLHPIVSELSPLPLSLDSARLASPA